MRYTIYLTDVECSTVKYFAFIRAPPGIKQKFRENRLVCCLQNGQIKF